MTYAISTASPLVLEDSMQLKEKENEERVRPGMKPLFSLLWGLRSLGLLGSTDLLRAVFPFVP